VANFLFALYDAVWCSVKCSLVVCLIKPLIKRMIKRTCSIESSGYAPTTTCSTTARSRIFPRFALARRSTGATKYRTHSKPVSMRWQREYFSSDRWTYYSRLTLNTRPSRGYSRVCGALRSRTTRFYDHTQIVSRQIPCTQRFRSRASRKEEKKTNKDKRKCVSGVLVAHYGTWPYELSYERYTNT